MRDHADPRALAFAVAASLGLHAALLALRAPESPSLFARSPAPIVARLAEAEVSPVVEAPPAAAIRKVLKPKPRAPVPTVVTATAVTATSIPQYRAQFIVEAARYKREPLPGLEGDVVLRLEISATGELAEVTVKRSSGQAMLDEQAIEMVRLAAPQVPTPPALRGRAFGFDVRAVYSLKD